MPAMRDSLKCPDCHQSNSYERDNDGVIEIKCPDCGIVFGENELPSKWEEWWNGSKGPGNPMDDLLRHRGQYKRAVTPTNERDHTR